MSVDYLKDLVSLEHSYVKLPSRIKSRFMKDSTQLLFQDSDDTQSNFGASLDLKRGMRCYSLALMEIRSLRGFIIKENTPLFLNESLNNVSGNDLSVEIFRKLSDIIRDYSYLVQQAYEERGFSEKTVCAHRILTEHFGFKFLTLLLSVYEFSELISSLINTIFQFINDVHILYYLDLVVFAKNLVPNLAPFLHYKNGLIKMEQTRFFWEGRYTIENVAKMVDLMWVPALPTNSLIDSNQLAIIFIPPLPFALRSGVSEIESEIYGDTSTWIDRFNVFRRNFSSIARLMHYRTEYIPTNELDNEESLRYWVDTLSYNINIKIANIKSRFPSSSVIVIGWSAGASLAYKLYLANPKNVQCLVLINFPTVNLENKKKVLTNMQLENTKCPVLFISGDASLVSMREDIESIRDSMSCPTSFILAQRCDDLLLMNNEAKINQTIPQDLCDLVIVEKILNFIRHHYLGDSMAHAGEETNRLDDTDMLNNNQCIPLLSQPFIKNPLLHPEETNTCR